MLADPLTEEVDRVAKESKCDGQEHEPVTQDQGRQEVLRESPEDKPWCGAQQPRAARPRKVEAKSHALTVYSKAVKDLATRVPSGQTIRFCVHSVWVYSWLGLPVVVTADLLRALALLPGVRVTLSRVSGRLAARGGARNGCLNIVFQRR